MRYESLNPDIRMVLNNGTQYWLRNTHASTLKEKDPQTSGKSNRSNSDSRRLKAKDRVTESLDRSAESRL